MGVSPDAQETSDRFKDSLSLPFPLVGDPEGKISAAYDVRVPLFGFVQRVTYVIGRDGKVEKAYKAMLDAESHVSEATKACSAGGR